MMTSLGLYQEHLRVHLQNPQNNYVVSDNCRFCVRDRIKHYANQNRRGWRRPRRNAMITEYTPLLSNVDSNDYDSLSNLEDVKVTTSLRSVNNASSIKISLSPDLRCVVCQDAINPGSIIRQLYCYHAFHIHCIDRWLEQNQTCPLCMSDIRDH